MSYVQGTQLRLDVTITDNDSGLPTDPTTLICRIENPAGYVYDQTLAGGTVLKLATGQYRAIMDTSPSPKIWLYEWIADNKSIAKGQVNVRAALTLPTPVPVGASAVAVSGASNVVVP